MGTGITTTAPDVQTVRSVDAIEVDKNETDAASGQNCTDCKSKSGLF
jgi:hypothetical protein